MALTTLDTIHEQLTLRYVAKCSQLDDCDIYPFQIPEKVRKRTVNGQREFRLGRICAQQDLTCIKEIGINESGAPLWPGLMKGSISHSKDYVIAVSSLSPQTLSLGIDIEQVVSDKRIEVIKRVALSSDEIDLLDSYSSDLINDVATIMFSAKESLYKLINPLSLCYINFHEGIVKNIDFEKSHFTIELKSTKSELSHYCAEYHGTFYRIESNLVTLLVLNSQSQ